MKCQDAEKEILSQLDESAFSSDLRTHFLQCPSCAFLLANFREIDSTFQSAHSMEPNPFLWTRIEGRLSRRSVLSSWSGWLRLPAPAWLIVSALIVFSSLITTFQKVSVNPDDLIAHSGIGPNGMVNTANPFLIAQTDVVDGSNPFLEAMAPRRHANPFQLRRVP